MHIPTPRLTSRFARLLGWVAALLILLAVFAMYTVPGFMVMLACAASKARNPKWTCEGHNCTVQWPVDDRFS